VIGDSVKGLSKAGIWFVKLRVSLENIGRLC
jgi:hypothetical protein